MEKVTKSRRVQLREAEALLESKKAELIRAEQYLEDSRDSRNPEVQISMSLEAAREHIGKVKYCVNRQIALVKREAYKGDKTIDYTLEDEIKQFLQEIDNIEIQTARIAVKQKDHPIIAISERKVKEMKSEYDDIKEQSQKIIKDAAYTQNIGRNIAKYYLDFYRKWFKLFLPK